MKHLRFLGGRRIGLVGIAFTGPSLRDSFGNFWTVETDLAMQRYERRPLYFQHRARLDEAGYIERANCDVRQEGLWIEVELLDNETGEACLNLVRSDRGFGSTGVMPGSWRERQDGFVELWPWVECSITDRPATRAGLTRAGIVQRSLGGIEVANSEMFLDRGPVWPVGVDLSKFWRSDGVAVTPDQAPAHGGNGNTPPAAVTPPVAAVTAEQVEAIMRRMMAENQPEPPAARQLPPAVVPGGLRTPEAGPGAGIQVRHGYEDLTLGALAFRGQMMLRAGKLRGDGETVLVRALREKIEKQRRRDDALTDAQIMAGATRMIDQNVFDDWGGHIRADEAMTSVYNGYGDQLVPTLLNSVVWYHFMLEARVLNALNSFVMPSQPYDWPIVTGGPTIRKVAEIEDQANFTVTASPIPVSKIATSKITFTAGQLGALVLGSRELFEDSGVAIANVWFEQMIRQMASAIDYVLLNGDESATATNIAHYGTDPTGTAYDKAMILDGLRHIAFANSDTAAQTAMSADTPGALRALMGSRGKFGLYPRDLVIIADPKVYYQFLALDTFESLADMGSQATLLTGQVGQVKGVPMIVSEELEATNASGQIEDSHDTVLGSYLVVNKNNVLVGRRRDISTELFPVPGANGFAADITVRLDLQEMEAGNVAYGYNVGG